MSAARAQIWKDKAEAGGNIINAKKKAYGTDSNPHLRQAVLTHMAIKR